MMLIKVKFQLISVFVFGVFSVCAAAAFAAPKINTLASLSSIQGEVQVQKGGAGDWTAAAEGMLLRAGDVVKTGSKSSCAIKWSQDNIVKLTAFSTMKIEQLEKNPAAGSENSSLDLWTGKMYAKAKKLSTPSSTFEVRTPTAIAGVRGTKLAVEVGADESTAVECLEGSVSVKGTAGGEVVLGNKEKTTVKKNEAPQPPQKLDEKDEKDFEEAEEISEAVLEIMQPVGNLETDTTPIAIKGKTDPGSSVNVNGQTVTADNNGIFTATVDLTEGVNQIKIESVNKQGKSKTVNRVIKYRPITGEPTAPTEIQLSITSPMEGMITREPSVTVTGAVTPGAEVSVNSIPAMLPPGSGTFSANVFLIEGENILTVTARLGSLGQTITRTVTKDTTPPVLIISQPAAGFGINTGGCELYASGIRCAIIGRTEADAILTINGARYPVESDGSFEHAIVLSYDQSTINVAATDAMGNRTTALLTRSINRAEIGYIEITVSPDSIVANGRDTAIVSVVTLNLLRERIDAPVVLSFTPGGDPELAGSISPATLMTSGGAGTAVFTAGIEPATVTITASSGSLSSRATLVLRPDRPPKPGE